MNKQVVLSVYSLVLLSWFLLENSSDLAILHVGWNHQLNYVEGMVNTNHVAKILAPCHRSQCRTEREGTWKLIQNTIVIEALVSQWLGIKLTNSLLKGLGVLMKHTFIQCHMTWSYPEALLLGVQWCKCLISSRTWPWGSFYAGKFAADYEAFFLMVAMLQVSLTVEDVFMSWIEQSITWK